jgi:hypothetical protein
MLSRVRMQARKRAVFRDLREVAACSVRGQGARGVDAAQQRQAAAPPLGRANTAPSSDPAGTAMRSPTDSRRRSFLWRVQRGFFSPLSGLATSRELLNTLRRAAIWSDGVSISAEDARDALLPAAGPARQDVLGRPLGGGFHLSELLEEVARHYLGRAMDESQRNKTKAAELVGLPSYQTLTNWLAKYGVGA